MFIVKRRTRAEYNAITNKNPNIVYFVAEGTTLGNATRYSLYIGDKLVSEEIDLSGLATETFVNNAVSNHNTSGTAHTDIRGLINTLTGNLESLEEIVEALEGAYIYRGTITTSGANPTPAQLNARIVALLDRPAQLGDVLVTEDSNPEYDKNEWYFNGTIWNNLGQFIIAQATTSVAGIVKLSEHTTIGSLDGNSVITEDILKTIVNTQLLRKDIDDYVKTVNGAVGDVIIHGLNILMSGEVAGKQLQSVAQSVYNSSSNKVDLLYGSNLDAESHDVGDVIRIRVNAPVSYWKDSDEQEWGAFKDNHGVGENPLDTYQNVAPDAQTFQNNLRNFANNNYPPEELEAYWFIVGTNTDTDETHYVMTLIPTAEYAYYEVVNVSVPDDRAVSEAIYEAEGRIDTIETALDWDN